MRVAFIEVSGVVINVSQIAFADFRQAGQATIHIHGNSVVETNPDAVESLRDVLLADAGVDPVAEEIRHLNQQFFEISRSDRRRFSSPPPPPNQPASGFQTGPAGEALSSVAAIAQQGESA